MKLKFKVTDIAEVPEQFQSLYEEKDGAYVFTAIDGLRTQEDINRLNESLRKEREDHKATRQKYSVFGDRDLQAIIEDLDKIEEYKLAAKGVDEDKLNEMVNARLKRHTNPLERERDQLQKQISELTSQVEQFKQFETKRKISDAVNEAIRKSQGFVGTATEDALMFAERVFQIDENGAVVTSDNSGFTAGLEPSVWLTEMQAKRPHWWGATVGGGSTGSRSSGNMADNPWSKAHWNLTRQMQIEMENPQRAEQLAKLAGSHIGADNPPA